MSKNIDRGGSSSSVNRAADRKTIEKNRRNHMKGLCMNLFSLIPPSHFIPPKQYLSLPDQIEQSAEYIKLLRQRVEELRIKRTHLTPTIHTSTDGSHFLPILEINELHPDDLVVVLITGLTKKFKLHQVISVLEEEGANVNTVSVTNDGYQIIHTFHAKVKIVRIGIDILKLRERVKQLIS